MHQQPTVQISNQSGSLQDEIDKLKIEQEAASERIDLFENQFDDALQLQLLLRLDQLEDMTFRRTSLVSNTCDTTAIKRKCQFTLYLPRVKYGGVCDEDCVRI